MSKYIRAVVAAEAIADKYGIPLGNLVDTFADIPAADVVEVVRCRECKYSHEDEIFGNRWCVSHLGCRKVKDDGYCYLGELKEGAGNE